MKQTDSPLGNALTRSGLSQREASVILRTTLLTAHRYIHGQVPQATLRARFDTTVSVINALVDAQKLPLKFNAYNKDERVRRAAAIKKLQAHIDNLLRG